MHSTGKSSSFWQSILYMILNYAFSKSAYELGNPLILNLQILNLTVLANFGPIIVRAKSIKLRFLLLAA